MASNYQITHEEANGLRAMSPQIVSLKDTIARLKRIGVPVDEYEARLDQLVQQRDGFLREFGPTGTAPRP